MSKVCQLFSGSSGNSIFVSYKETKILVDAGVSNKRICRALSDIGEDASELSAIFVTHEHSDHISGLRVLASKYNIPVFAAQDVIDAMKNTNIINEKVETFPIENNMEIAGIEILPFKLSHDSVSCHGYRFNLGSSRSVGVCTDTGYVTEEAEKTLKGSNLIFLESNHEVTMLQNSAYPYHLKKRILSEVGHLSNFASSEFAKELAKSGTTRFVLAHLSRENNTPDIARENAVSALWEEGFKENSDYRLYISAPVNSEKAITL
ncbi:MAG: MBL fold metallo-hydrolase [Eubacterium sp.]|nr:MBL fold metallo-hydrolase [Eubacterium sp.]